MKIRNGFVSNSSSTSWVLTVPLPESIDKQAAIDAAIDNYYQEESSWYEKKYGINAKEAWAEDYKYRIKKITETIESGRQPFTEVSVEYGGEESIDSILKAINKYCGLDIQSECHDY